jgi:hypothetical protein
MKDAVIAQQKTGAIGTKLHKLAKACWDVDEFLAKCAAEEEWVVSAKAGQSRMETVPTCWTQAKSDIKQAWGHNITPNSKPSYHAIRDAKIQANKAAKGQSGTAPTGATPQAKPSEPAKAKEEGKVHTVIPLPPELKDLVMYLNRLDEIGRARAIKRYTKDAKRLADIKSNPQESARAVQVSTDSSWDKQWSNAKAVG